MRKTIFAIASIVGFHVRHKRCVGRSGGTDANTTNRRNAHALFHGGVRSHRLQCPSRRGNDGAGRNGRRVGNGSSLVSSPAIRCSSSPGRMPQPIVFRRIRSSTRVEVDGPARLDEGARQARIGREEIEPLAQPSHGPRCQRISESNSSDCELLKLQVVFLG